ncbi:MAG: DUF3084 domain-containing protein [Cyanobacterium sp. T60_A2020_053]|nr:DUF3084 domain-containing protein [Cyanobacterium sp. T60_A2020_053]
MTSAYVLIFAVLILGGLIAALGDRIGTKVGKARLRLFDLRPKQTAIVITIVTGIAISASTLGVLFALSQSLRQGVFQLDEILSRRQEVEEELALVSQAKEEAERELQEARQKQSEATKILVTTETELDKTQQQLQELSNQTEILTKEVAKIETERKDLLTERERLLAERIKITEETKSLQSQLSEKDQELRLRLGEIQEKEQILAQQSATLEDLNRQQQELRAEVKFRDQEISKLDQAIAQRDQTLGEKEELLARLERDLKFFQKEVEVLEQYYRTYQDLRERPIAIVRGQLLTVTLVRVEKNTDLEQLIDGVLNEANRGARAILGYGNDNPNQRFVQISKRQVEQIQSQIAGGGEFLIQILSAGNYVQGEETIRIFTDVAPNRRVYRQNEVIASTVLDDSENSNTAIQEKLDFLISVSQFRARQQGILGRIVVGDGQIISLVNFVQQVQESEQSIDEIRAIAKETTYSAGPLQITLSVIANGEEVFRL